MTDQEFWQLVTASDVFATSDQLAEQLKARLTPLDNETLAAFDKAFNLKMRESYRWDLWGAAYLIAACNSEFAFSEFRCWLISRGQEVFERTLKKPDDLADFDVMSRQEQQPYPYLDEYDLIAGQLYEDRVEQELPFMPSGQDQPKGKRFKDRPKLLKTNYPKLFALYRS